MEDPNNFLERTKLVREALKKRAIDIENNTAVSKSDILDSRIEDNIKSSLQFYKANPSESHINSLSLQNIREIRSRSENMQKKSIEKDLFKLPEIKKAYLPYLQKPSEFPLQKTKRIKRFRVDFTGVEPKIKKLKQAYSTLSFRA
jgi:endonuclease III-like uncharacterized protein